MLRQTADVMGIPVDNVNMDEALKKALSLLSEDHFHMIFTPNAEIMMTAFKDSLLKEALSSADLLIPDGAGVVLASRILGKPLKEKVPGFDLVKNLLKQDKTKIRFFLFGAKPGIAEKAAENILKDYTSAEVAGIRNGYFTEAQEADIVREINASGADILIVALGAPKQEKWIYKYRDVLKVKAAIGVGGTIDILSGKTELLAPEFFRRNGLEWLYRLYREPSRFRRMLALPKYILKAVWARIAGR